MKRADLLILDRILQSDPEMVKKVWGMTPEQVIDRINRLTYDLLIEVEMNENSKQKRDEGAA